MRSARVPRRVVWPWRHTTTRLLVRHPLLRRRSVDGDGCTAAFPRSSTGREALPPRPRARGGFRPRQGSPVTPPRPGRLAGPVKPATAATLIRRAREIGQLLPHGTRHPPCLAPPSERAAGRTIPGAHFGTVGPPHALWTTTKRSPSPPASRRRAFLPRRPEERLLAPPKNVILWLLRSASAPAGCAPRRRPFLGSPSREGTVPSAWMEIPDVEPPR